MKETRHVLLSNLVGINKVTIHVLRDIDLFSSFANFELDLADKKLALIKEEGYIRLFLQEL